MLKRAVVLVMMLFVTLSCSLLDPRDPIQVAVLGDTFMRRPGGLGAQVPFRIENVGKRAVFLTRCGEAISLTIERRVGVRWESYAGAACVAVVAQAPLELPAGSRVDAVTAIRDAGRFRLRPGVAFGNGQADWSFASRAFEVK